MPTRIMNWVILIPFLATMSSSNLRISSFNCRGLSIYRDITSVNNDIVRNLSGSSDIILLQETWLFKQDLGKLNDFIPEFYGYGEVRLTPLWERLMGILLGVWLSCGRGT